MTFDEFLNYVQKLPSVSDSRLFASDPQYQRLCTYALDCGSNVFREMGLYLKQCENYNTAGREASEMVSNETKAEAQKAYEAVLNYKKADWCKIDDLMREGEKEKADENPPAVDGLV